MLWVELCPLPNSYVEALSPSTSELTVFTDRAFKESIRDFPGGAVVEKLPANAGDTGSGPGLGRSHMPRSN